MKPSDPGIRAEERGKVQMEDLRPIPAQEPAEVSDRVTPEGRRIGEHLKGNVRLFQIAAYLLDRQARKTKHALPSPCCQLRRQFVAVGLNPTDPEWLDIENRENGELHEPSLTDIQGGGSKTLCYNAEISDPGWLAF